MAARYTFALDKLDELTGMVDVFPRYSGDETAENLPIAEKGKPILAAAINLDCRALITGDRTHFVPLFGKSVQDVTIYSPSLAAQALLG